MLDSSQLDWGVFLNVKALLFSFLLSCLYFRLNHQIPVCLPTYRLVFLLCQTGTLPGLSLRLVDLCLMHLKANTRGCMKKKPAGVFISFILLYSGKQDL